MRIIFLLFTLLVTNSYAQDFGAGSDGVCTFSGLQVKATWNCTDITVTGNTTFPGTSAVVLRATGAVTVNTGFTLSVAGATLTAGPGGSNGGDCVGTCDKVDGSGTGAGSGGAIGVDAGFNVAISNGLA